MELTPELSYIIGLIGGDGNLSEKRTTITDKNFEFHETVIRNKFKKTFVIIPIISPMKTKKGKITYRSRINSKTAHKIFSEEFHLQTNKNKTFSMRTPTEIMNARKEIFSEYIKGWMDAEGWVTTKKVKRKNKTYMYPRIAFNVSNENIRNELVLLLNNLGINPSIWKSGKMFGFQIIGVEKVKKYKEFVGFEHPDKIKKLDNLTYLRPNAAYNA